MFTRIAPSLARRSRHSRVRASPSFARWNSNDLKNVRSARKTSKQSPSDKPSLLGVRFAGSATMIRRDRGEPGEEIGKNMGRSGSSRVATSKVPGTRPRPRRLTSPPASASSSADTRRRCASAADGDDVGGAVAVEVAAAEVLGGDVAVDDGAVPGRAVEVVDRDAIVPARGGRRRPRRRRRRRRRRPRGRGRRRGCRRSPSAGRTSEEASAVDSAGQVDGDLGAVPGLDRGEEPAAVLEPADVDLARASLGGLARARRAMRSRRGPRASRRAAIDG